ncbi:MAG: substrate-binding domain-containing protein [Cyanophyceae cyanobacterium]
MNRPLASVGIILASLGLTYAPLPGVQRTVIVVSGTELQEPLEKLEPRFEQENPNIDLKLEFQGSQDIVNNYVERRNDFTPTVLIPANGVLLEELSDRLTAQGETPFTDAPQSIAKTMLVGIAWPERGQVLFPTGFEWDNIEEAMEQRNWETIGGEPWGSFDFITTDPTRSNSGQLTLSLWTLAEMGDLDLNSPAVAELYALIKSSVYQPPRSTDILLQEFITRGPNDADVATVYESIALYRWSQAQTTQGQAYQIYYLDPTIETVATAAIMRRDVDSQTTEAARQFLEFLTAPQQQEVFAEYGFRPTANVDLQSVPNSPWSQGIPGAQVAPAVEIVPPPDTAAIREIQRVWNRVN